MITVQLCRTLLTYMIRWVSYIDKYQFYILSFFCLIYFTVCVCVYEQGLGRKKCLDERRQHNSHFCLCHHDTPLGSEKRDHSAYQTDFLPKQETEATGATITRRFPRNHSARSQMNAAAQAGECFMWFGKHNSKEHISLSVLATSNH